MTTPNTPATPEELIRSYNLLVGGIEDEAMNDEERAYGGIIRAAKGKLVESLTPHIIQLAWQEAGGSLDRLSFGDVKTYKVPVQPDYVERLPDEIRAYVNARRDNHFYRAKVDRHVFIDGMFVMGIECKSSTENAMLKRILVDFRLLKSLHPNLVCCLLQLESQLGGSYSQPLANPQTGSPSTHTLMSYFPEVRLTSSLCCRASVELINLYTKRSISKNSVENLWIVPFANSQNCWRYLYRLTGIVN